MAQQYVVVSRKNPMNPEAPKKYYGLSRSYRRISVEEICKRIGERSSFSTGELEGAIGEFLLEIQNVLSAGDIAQIGKLGNFRLVLQTHPAVTAKDFGKTNIKGCKVNFHPSTQLLDMCRNVKFIPYVADNEKQAGEAEGAAEMGE